MERKRRKSGSSTIIFVFILFLFIIFLCFVVDAISIANKEYVATRTIQFVTRRLSIQGGISNSIPVNFVTSGSNNYLTTNELIDYVDEQMKKAMIASDEWEIVISGRGINLGSNSASYIENQKLILSPANRSGQILIDYLDGIDVELSYDYSWNLFVQATGIGGGEVSHTFKQHSMSEFKYDYDWWEGEHYDNEAFEEYEILETN